LPHLYVLIPKLCGGILKNLSAIYTQSSAHYNSSPIFGVFEIFDRNFAKIVAPPGGGKGKLCSASERAFHCEKRLKTASKLTHKT